MVIDLVRQTDKKKPDDTFDVFKARYDFPVLSQKIRGKPLVYLDNATTTQKPRAVIETVQRFYSVEYAGVHGSQHYLGQRATNMYEESRRTIARFLNASADEIIFTGGATDAINIVIQGYARRLLDAGDEIVITALEHASNSATWQALADEKGLKLRVAPVNERGDITLGEFQSCLNDRTKLVAMTHVADTLGGVTPIKEMIQLTKRWGIPTLVDAVQAVAHFKTDVRDLNCDFLVFSGHTIYGPMGVGVLYGRRDRLEKMRPLPAATEEPLPRRFEAGTPPVAAALGLAAAVDYVARLGFDKIGSHEKKLTEQLIAGLSKISRVRIVGHPIQRAPIVAFEIEGVSSRKIFDVLDSAGIATGLVHHGSLVRVSNGLYNTSEEIEVLVRVIRELDDFRTA